MHRAAAAMLLIVSGLPVVGCARDCQPAVSDGWIRQGPPSMPMRAGFGRIENDCPAPLVITGASSASFGDVSVHESTVVDGISRMRAIPELVVPANGSATLAPGGLHLMLGEPRTGLAVGDAIVVEFSLRDGGTLRGEFEVR